VKRLAVWSASVLLGHLEQVRSGVRFTFDPKLVDRVGPGRGLVSMSLPTSHRAFTDKSARPFFDGLLPEGEARRIIAYDLGIAESDTFALLAQLGRDCAGALAILPDGEGPDEQTPPRESEALDDSTIDRLIANLRFNPLGVDQLVRVSLGGVQEKLLLTAIDRERWLLPSRHWASTHILKPTIGALMDSAINECVCLRFAQLLGVRAATTTIRSFGGREVLVVERFDRYVDTLGVVRRVHQENACQALGVPVVSTARKYEESGGPKLMELAQLLSRWSTRGEVEELLRQVTVNVFVGNADAHAMNTSFAISEGGDVTLSPMYDVFATTVYPQLSNTASMYVDGVTDLRAVTWQNVVNEGVAWGINPSRAHEIVSELAAKAQSVMPQALDDVGRVRIIPEWLRIALVHQVGRPF
jgi:serine/threonine-protein kinase HipA